MTLRCDGYTKRRNYLIGLHLRDSEALHGQIISRGASSFATVFLREWIAFSPSKKPILRI